MEKPTFKLVGAPCGHHGQYTFYKALRVSAPRDRIIAIGDFFFVKIWQDSELVSIGELQLLWTDRVSDQTLVSLRLYFLPENTPDGRGPQHGERFQPPPQLEFQCLEDETAQGCLRMLRPTPKVVPSSKDEVLALNEKVVLKAEDLLSWMWSGEGFRVGLRAVWRGACAPPPHSAPLHHSKLDFSDIDTEKSAIEQDINSPGVVVFSYPRYCRYRALLARLDGMQADWLRDSLVAALGGYAASTTNTTILYCKDTFEYPELEGHELIANHLGVRVRVRVRGRPRGRRRRAPRSRSRSQEHSDNSTDSETQQHRNHKQVLPRRLSLRTGAGAGAGAHSEEEDDSKQSPEDQQFLQQLRQFYKDRGETLTVTHALKDLSLRTLYLGVLSLGGHEAVCRGRLWRALHQDRPARVRSLYERFLLPFENHERRSGRKANGKIEEKPIVDTIDVPDSPRSPCKKEDMTVTSRPAEELNREFLESLQREEKPLISIKPVHQLIESEAQSAEPPEPRAAAAAPAGAVESTIVQLLNKQASPDALTSLSALGDKYVNGHVASPDQKCSRPLGRSSLRAVRVKPARTPASNHTPPTSSRPDSASSSPPATTPVATGANVATMAPLAQVATVATNFGIHHPPPHSDDDIVEVPYKPKTPEIIDLDEYPESPQASKKKKLDILKERGLEVTAVPQTWPQVTPPGVITPLINPPMLLNPMMQHQIMTQASLFQMHNMLPQKWYNATTLEPPKVIQSSSLFGSSGPEKTVYGNPKDPFMPPPHILLGTPVKPQRTVSSDKPETRQDILDLTCKTSTSPIQKPAVEIVRIPNVPSPKSSAQNLSKNYTILDGKAVVGSNLEITLVNPKQSPHKNRPPQKRSSNGKFVSSKTATPPKDYPKNYPSPSGLKTTSPNLKKSSITIPSYPINREDISPTSSTGSKDSFKPYLDKNVPNLDPKLPLNDMQKSMPVPPFVDPMYMSALYSSLAGQIDQRQLAMYRDLMASQFRYSSLLGGVGTPTTKN